MATATGVTGAGVITAGVTGAGVTTTGGFTGRVVPSGAGAGVTASTAGGGVSFKASAGVDTTAGGFRLVFTAESTRVFAPARKNLGPSKAATARTRIVTMEPNTI